MIGYLFTGLIAFAVGAFVGGKIVMANLNWERTRRLTRVAQGWEVPE